MPFGIEKACFATFMHREMDNKNKYKCLKIFMHLIIVANVIEIRKIIIVSQYYENVLRIKSSIIRVIAKKNHKLIGTVVLCA
jgi:hypothetical protein